MSLLNRIPTTRKDETQSSTARKTSARPQDPLIKCPRCDSPNTKFCYYNNYSLTQPRHFCKTCRRYWTEGGSLRNIPVGGGSRKNKRSSNASSNSSSTSSSSNNISSKKLPDLVPPPQIPHQQNPKILETQDLNLGFSIHHHHNHHDFKALTEMIQVPNYENNTKLDLQNPSSSSSPSSHHHLSSLELLTGFTTTTSSSSRGLNSFMPPLPVVTNSTDPTTVYSSSGFTLPEFKPNSLNFSLDGLGSNYGSFQGVQETNGKLLFPFEDLKQQVSSNTNDASEQNRDHQHGADSTAGFWNGVIGGGSW